MYIDTALSEKGYTPVVKTRPAIDLVTRFKLFSPLAVFAAGLIDGINPCAFTAIIFFISFLTLQGYSKRQILTIGLSFIIAVFITYVLIGLGLFKFLFKLKGYPTAVNFLYLGGAILCFVLAGLAFYDFLKFRRTRQSQSLVLQLPDSLKNKIHRIIGLYYRKTKDKDTNQMSILRLIISAFVVGFFVSLFEAACTGQVYLPTIVYVLKYTHMKLEAFFYLLLYNLMFIFPLWIIMLFALWGVSSQQFSKFTQKHMGTIKILMMVLFLGLGLFLIWK
jgi:cytochrome c biogenesis protein CcdA